MVGNNYYSAIKHRKYWKFAFLFVSQSFFLVFFRWKLVTFGESCRSINRLRLILTAYFSIIENIYNLDGYHRRNRSTFWGFISWPADIHTCLSPCTSI